MAPIGRAALVRLIRAELADCEPEAARADSGRGAHLAGDQGTGAVMKAQLHLTRCEMDAPRYTINPGSPDTGPFATIDLGHVELYIGSPAELRRLADVAANAADVLEQAQAQARPASRCCDQATHDALRESDAWNRLEFVGYQDDGQGEKLELRNCPCGATLAILARESPSGPDGAGLARVAG